MTPSVLDVTDLTVHASATPLVGPVSLRINEGERVALVGESGSGKSLTAATVLGELPHGLHATGRILLGGIDVPTSPKAHVRPLPGRVVGAVFQDPRTSLNVLSRVGPQLMEPLVNSGTPRRVARSTVMELLERMRLKDPAALLRRHPGTLSGGQRQRIAIALALSTRPRLLIADEPTSALDMSVQADVLACMKDALQDSALLLITHDLAVGADLCSRTMVMHAGTIVDDGPTEQVLTAPSHPRSQLLVEASTTMSLALPARQPEAS